MRKYVILVQGRKPNDGETDLYSFTMEGYKEHETKLIAQSVSCNLLSAWECMDENSDVEIFSIDHSVEDNTNA